MKILYLITSAIVLLHNTINAQTQSASNNTTEISAIAPATEQGNNLELGAVLELFKESESLEQFEKKLNDEKNGVNNLDLNEDSLIDYIRVVEQTDDKYRIIILQAVIGENEFQDVATINVEHISDEEINVQIQGDEEIYGNNYYVEPPIETHVHIHLWPIWPVIFAPHYVVYRSPFYWRHYPPYWRPFRPVPIHVYHTRNIIVTGRTGFYYTRRPVVVRPPVYRRHYSSRVRVRPNNHRNTYTRNTYTRNNNSRTPNNKSSRISNKTQTRNATNKRPSHNKTTNTRQNKPHNKSVNKNFTKSRPASKNNRVAPNRNQRTRQSTRPAQRNRPINKRTTRRRR
jgi:hypothetical protein